MPDVVLRPYQREAVDAACAMLERWRSPLLTLATGTGKTTIGAAVVAEQLHRGRVLWVAHRRELVEQAAERMLSMGIDARIARGKATGAGAQVVVTTVQTAVRRLGSEGFALVVVDEAHHAASATQRRILDHYRVPWLGLTATPGRADGAALGHDGVAYSYGIREAVRDGYLVRPIGQRIRCGIKADELKTSGGDYTLASAGLCVLPGLPEFVSGVAERIGDRRTIAFLPTVETAHAAAELWRGLGLTAEAVDGRTPAKEREAVLGRVRSGETQVLVNCMLFTEGFDAPETSAIAICRPTRNAGLYQQMAGRGLRTAPGKADCLILDMAGADCDLVSETATSAYGPADERAAASGERVDVLDAIDLAEAEAAARARYVAEVEELDLLRARRSKGRPVKPGQLGIEWVDDGSVPSIADARRIMAGGIAPPMSGAEAAAVLAWLEGRDGMATAKQARALRRYGCRMDLERSEADAAVEVMVACGWRNNPAMKAGLARWRR